MLRKYVLGTIVVSLFLLGCMRPCIGQMEDADVDNLAMADDSATTSRLTWTPVPAVACQFSVTYSVFRSKVEDFEPSPSTLIASGITHATYTARGLQNEDSYFHVRAIHHPVQCESKDRMLRMTNSSTGPAPASYTPLETAASVVLPGGAPQKTEGGDYGGIEFFCGCLAFGVLVVWVFYKQQKQRAQKLAAMSPTERSEFLAEERRLQKESSLDRLHGPRKPMVVCPHCQTRGQVRLKTAKRKKGVSGGKATAAILTVGLSVVAVGLSRKEGGTEAHCANCDSQWFFAS